MNLTLADLAMRHVDASKLLVQRTDMSRDASDAAALPDWYESASDGSLSFAGWYNGSVMATLETRARRKFYVAVVAVSALFASNEQIKQQPLNVKDDSLLDAATEDELSEFRQRAMVEMFPFLRQELYQLTGHFHGLSGVMLQPHATIKSPES